MFKRSGNLIRGETPGEHTVFKWLSVQECADLRALGSDFKQGFMMFSENR